MNNIVLLGAPGSGKGTISSCLVEKYNFYQISTGELLREISNSNSELSYRIQKILSKGELVPDEIVAEILEQKIKECKNNETTGLIFDGYPRNFLQTKMLDNILGKHDLTLTKAIELDISLEELKSRILNRFACSNCGETYNYITKPTKIENICDKCGSQNFSTRSDDNIDVLTQRYKTYEQNIEQIRDYYSRKNLYKKINASLSTDDIQRKVSEIIEL